MKVADVPIGITTKITEDTIKKMKAIEIPGNYGTGGGAIVRVALSLSALTGKAFHVTNIRVKRKNPGLAAQHLAGVKAVAKLCNAKVKGASIGSTELYFEPGKIETKKLRINIGTAGSIPLVLGALMPSLTGLEKIIEIEIKGGTDIKMAPSIDYVNNVLLKLLEKMNYSASIDILRRGFYPKGGGTVHFNARPMKLKRYDFIDMGKLLKIEGISVASQHLTKAKVAKRQANEAQKLLGAYKEFSKLPIIVKSKYVESYSPGSVITLWLESENSFIGSTALGERGKSSEKVALEAVNNLIAEYKREAVVDVHAADQLLLYLVLTKGSLKTSKISEHTRTNAYVIEKFLPIRFEMHEKDNVIAVKKI